jgi:tripartite-type tricarboxylate transporter receptor subunit TctC
VSSYFVDGRDRLCTQGWIQDGIASRLPPDVPTLNELGYKDFEATSWIGLLTTGGTPKPIIDRYSRELVKILHMPDIQQKLREMEFEVVASTPDQFGAWIKTEIGRWGKVIKDTGAKAE